MRTLEENGGPPGGIVLVEHRPLRAVTVAGLFAALLALVPLTIAPGIEPLRLLTFGVLAAASVAFVRLGWSRPERTLLVPKDGALRWGAEELPKPIGVALDGDGNEEPPLYQALVRFSDGSTRVALERADPGLVLRDALVLARRLGVELRPGWGLERHFPETEFLAAWETACLEVPDALAARGAVDLSLWPVQRKTAAACLAAGLFVPLVTLGLARSPARSVSPSALELWLTALSSLVGIALGALFFGLRRRVTSTGGRLRTSLVLFGTSLGNERELGPAVRRAFAVAPDASFARHVLFPTNRGPLSIPADPEGAERLAARALEPSLGERAAPAARVTSARYRSPDRPARLRS
ncbi:MAG TPA: hypothetical protein VFZ53_26045 [Polyangiaceae bacterium]